MPNSSRLVFPATTAPASSNCSTTVALNGLVNLIKFPDAHVVGRSRVQILSLTEIRRPSKLDRGLSKQERVSIYDYMLFGSLPLPYRHTLLSATVCIPHLLQPWPRPSQRGNEGIEGSMSLLVSDTFLSFPQKGHLGLSERVDERGEEQIGLLSMSKDSRDVVRAF